MSGLARRGSGIFLLCAVTAIALLLPLTSASGSGYNLSFSRAPGSSSDSHVDLISLSSTDLGGGKLKVSFQVSGTLLLSDSLTSYIVYFGGSGQADSTGWVTFNNNTTVGSEVSTNTGAYFGELPFTVGSGGSSITFQINESDVGAASGFSLNAYAESSHGGGFVGSSQIGSNYFGFQPIQNAINTIYWFYVGIGIAVLAIIVIIVVVLVVKRKKPPVQAYPQQYQQPNAPPYAPGTGPSGSPQGAYSPPPPPPPPVNP